jgi:hypothetical protein
MTLLMAVCLFSLGASLGFVTAGIFSNAEAR